MDGLIKAKLIGGPQDGRIIDVQNYAANMEMPRHDGACIIYDRYKLAGVRVADGVRTPEYVYVDREYRYEYSPILGWEAVALEAE